MEKKIEIILIAFWLQKKGDWNEILKKKVKKSKKYLKEINLIFEYFHRKEN